MAQRQALHHSRILQWSAALCLLACAAGYWHYQSTVNGNVAALQKNLGISEQRLAGEDAVTYFRRVLPEKFLDTDIAIVRKTFTDAGFTVRETLTSSEVYYISLSAWAPVDGLEMFVLGTRIE